MGIQSEFLKFFFESYEQDVVASDYDFAIICQYVSAVEFFRVGQYKIHVGIDIIHSSSVLYFAL